jgi:hypothetical protein
LCHGLLIAWKIISHNSLPGQTWDIRVQNARRMFLVLYSKIWLVFLIFNNLWFKVNYLSLDIVTRSIRLGFDHGMRNLVDSRLIHSEIRENSGVLLKWRREILILKSNFTGWRSEFMIQGINMREWRALRLEIAYELACLVSLCDLRPMIYNDNNLILLWFIRMRFNIQRRWRP